MERNWPAMTPIIVTIGVTPLGIKDGFRVDFLAGDVPPDWDISDRPRFIRRRQEILQVGQPGIPQILIFIDSIRFWFESTQFVWRLFNVVHSHSKTKLMWHSHNEFLSHKQVWYSSRRN